MGVKYYVNTKIILGKTLKFATIININDDGIVVSYYDHNNKMIYELISNDDILSDEQYEVIRNRVNTIIDILK